MCAKFESEKLKGEASLEDLEVDGRYSLQTSQPKLCVHLFTPCVQYALNPKFGAEFLIFFLKLIPDTGLDYPGLVIAVPSLLRWTLPKRSQEEHDNDAAEPELKPGSHSKMPPYQLSKDIFLERNKCDVATLVERYLGSLYPNFPRVRPILVRQARDLLVCTFHGNLARFECEFCVPASQLLREVRDIADRKVILFNNGQDYHPLKEGLRRLSPKEAAPWSRSVNAVTSYGHLQWTSTYAKTKYSCEIGLRSLNCLRGIQHFQGSLRPVYLDTGSEMGDRKRVSNFRGPQQVNWISVDSGPVITNPVLVSFYELSVSNSFCARGGRCSDAGEQWTRRSCVATVRAEGEVAGANSSQCGWFAVCEQGAVVITAMALAEYAGARQSHVCRSPRTKSPESLNVPNCKAVSFMQFSNGPGLQLGSSDDDLHGDVLDNEMGVLLRCSNVFVCTQRINRISKLCTNVSTGLVKRQMKLANRTFYACVSSCFLRLADEDVPPKGVPKHASSWRETMRRGEFGFQSLTEDQGSLTKIKVEHHRSVVLGTSVDEAIFHGLSCKGTTQIKDFENSVPRGTLVPEKYQVTTSRSRVKNSEDAVSISAECLIYFRCRELRLLLPPDAGDRNCLTTGFDPQQGQRILISSVFVQIDSGAYPATRSVDALGKERSERDTDHLPPSHPVSRLTTERAVTNEFPERPDWRMRLDFRAYRIRSGHNLKLNLEHDTWLQIPPWYFDDVTQHLRATGACDRRLKTLSREICVHVAVHEPQSCQVVQLLNSVEARSWIGVREGDSEENVWICDAENGGRLENHSGDVVAPRGWPLSLGSSGVILQLGELDPTLLRNRDCYLCVRRGTGPRVEVAFVWKCEAFLSSRALAVTSPPHSALETPVTLEMAATDEGQDLPGLLQSLLVSVERAIERVPLDVLAFPCPRCRDEVIAEDNGVVCGCQCVCQQQSHVEKKDTSIQTSPMFEFVGSIPHIDSDEENDSAHEPDGTTRNSDLRSRGFRSRFGESLAKFDAHAIPKSQEGRCNALPRRPYPLIITVVSGIRAKLITYVSGMGHLRRQHYRRGYTYYGHGVSVDSAGFMGEKSTHSCHICCSARRTWGLDEISGLAATKMKVPCSVGSNEPCSHQTSGYANLWLVHIGLETTARRGQVLPNRPRRFDRFGIVHNIDMEVGTFLDHVVIMNRPELVTSPKRIVELPEKLLMSGIHLPDIITVVEIKEEYVGGRHIACTSGARSGTCGKQISNRRRTSDLKERPLVVVDAATVLKASLDSKQIASVLLYYASLPRPEKLKDGFTVLILCAESEGSALDLLDKALSLVAAQMNIGNVLLWRPPSTSDRWQLNHDVLENSRFKVHVVTDERDLCQYISEDQTPVNCGGRSTHDQVEWVEFYKEVEPFLGQCHACGRRLVSVMSELRSTEGQRQVTRRQLHHQHRALTRALTDPELQRLRREGNATLARLEERSQWLPASEDVRLSAERARRLFVEVDRAARRLEQLAEGRRERLRDLARVRALEDEATQRHPQPCLATGLGGGTRFKFRIARRIATSHAQNWYRWKEKLSQVYVRILRGRVVTLFAARGDMRENGCHRRQGSLCVLDFHVHRSVISVQRHFRTKFAADPPSGHTILAGLTNAEVNFWFACDEQRTRVNLDVTTRTYAIEERIESPDVFSQEFHNLYSSPLSLVIKWMKLRLAAHAECKGRA
ncbi:hypothetical protein L798_08872 [Zootermopsis nevadensis]|uniref:Uncharacterized protein n=1 Tax=Zootermopsis nevadensis TaxID=136037 RepID=A0A067RLN2_ZOONE|nr:hypothetical protein L798_08872 [Zootermopsis nevadensis]